MSSLDVPAFLHGLHEQLFGNAKRHPTLGTTLTETLLYAELLTTIMETKRALNKCCDLAAAAHKPRGNASASPPSVPVDDVGRSSDAVPA